MNGYPEGLKHFDYFEDARQFLTAYDDPRERPAAEVVAALFYVVPCDRVGA